MDLSIVITTRNRKSELLKCAESVRNSNFEGLEWELIVVDDHSSDGTEDLEFSDLGGRNGKMIHNSQQLMMVRSRNIGARAAKGSYVLFIDDDNILDPEMPRILFDFARRQKEIGIAGPSMYYQDTGKKSMDYQRINFLTGKTSYYISGRKGEYLESDGIPNVFLVKKEVFEKIGYFDESLVQTFTEPDFAFAARKAGYGCAVVSGAKTFHNISRDRKFEPDSLGGNYSQKAYCVMRNRTLVVCRYGNFLERIVYIALFSWVWPLAYSLIVLRRGRFDLVRLYWRGWLDGMKYFFTGKLTDSLKIPKVS